MWLTLSFYWSVCFYMYSIYATPTGPRPPLHIHTIAGIMQGHDARWKNNWCNTSPFTSKMYTNQSLTVIRQLLCNQLPLFRVIKRVSYSHRRWKEDVEHRIVHPPISLHEIKLRHHHHITSSCYIIIIITLRHHHHHVTSSSSHYVTLLKNRATDSFFCFE